MKKKKNKEIDIAKELTKRGYKYYPDWCAWMQTGKDTKTGKKVPMFVPGFGALTITDEDIEKLK